MAYFDSVAKSTKDFFKRSFSKDSSVEFSAKADNGVKVTLDGGVKTKVKVDKATKAESIAKTGSTSIKLEYKKTPVSLDKLEVASAGTVKADISVPDLVPNTKITFKVEDGHAAGANTSGKFGVETVQDFGVSAGVKAELDAVQGDGSFSLLLKKSGVLVGASTAFTTPLAPVAAPAEGEKAKAASFALTDYDAVLGYTTGAATFAVQSEKKFSAATGYVHAEVTPQVKVAGKATVSLAGKAKGPGSPIKGAIGGSYVVDKDVTLYGAVSDAAVLQGAAVLQVAPKATLTVYGEIDALNVEQDGKHFFGTKLALRA